ncbi:MAG: type II secretion system GspH family protein [Candidatus Omnitrophica bacterium]|nr:type II secretion system GspH family protein [Candidatus Omnitrophota bacterium]MBU1933097.1 type II secretion system GspH family protein [Candidatus Omnitrophota bacterium]
MRQEAGITLIELVLIIVLIGLVVPPLLTVFSDITRRSAQAELISTANALTRSLLEEIVSKKYDEKNSSPWSNPLGADSGETNRDAYDDVDDFDGFSEPSVPGFPGFSRSVTVYYVNPDSSNLDTPQPDSCNTLDYKRVDVTVNHQLIGDLKMSSIVSRSHF